MSSLRNIGHEKALELLTCRPVDIDCHCLDQGKSSPISMKTLPSRQSSRGRLDFLVPEISDQVLKLLDFESLANFRSTSYSCKVAVEGIREYVDVMVHAPGALRILRSTGTISLHSVWFIYQQLISSRCVVCNDYGPYLFLLTGDRCCFNCVNTQLRFRLIYYESFTTFFDISAADGLESLLIHSATLRQGDDDLLHWFTRDPQQPLKLVLLEQVLQQAVRICGGSENLLAAVESARRKHCLSPYGPVQEPDSEELFEVAGFFHPWLSLKGATSFPSLSLSTGKLEWGRWCPDCIGPHRVEHPYALHDPAQWYRDCEYDIRQPWEKRIHWLCLNDDGMKGFGDDEFLEVHFKTCQEAQERLKETLESV